MSGPDLGWIERAQAAGMSREDIQAYLDAWSRSVPVTDPAAERRRARDREYQKEKRDNERRQTSAESADEKGKERSPEPPKETTTKTLPTGEQKEAVPSATVVPIFPDAEDIDLALDAYRQVAEQRGLPLVRKMSDMRRRKLKQRLRDAGSLDGWYEACRKLQQSQFLQEIRADLDFMLQEKSFIRLIEGKYDNGKKQIQRG